MVVCFKLGILLVVVEDGRVVEELLVVDGVELNFKHSFWQINA